MSINYNKPSESTKNDNTRSENKNENRSENPRSKSKRHPRIPRNDDISDHIERTIKNNKKLNGSSSRKNQISINHLMEFSSYRDSPEYSERHGRPGRQSSQKPRASKAKLYLHGMRFINVNYKFVVDYRKDYRAQQLDPNVPVDTQDIIRIIVPKGNACPICLSEELIAPRMITSCGHILCLTCLLSLLESDVPTSMKKESKIVVEKYNDCPLCGSIIRKREIKPVQIDNVDERFEVPKINDEVVLTLMSRKASRIVPVPRWSESADAGDGFPWASESGADCNLYSRFFKGDFAFLTQMYEKEKADLEAAQQRDKELYHDDGKFYKLASQAIDDDISAWAAKFLAEEKTSPLLDAKNCDHTPQTIFYYYQTGFRASTTYVLSPLDMKVMKTSYNQDYSQMPNSVIAKVENIKFEELDAESTATKYKYLSHLPSGTSVGFLECNWQGNEFISPESWNTFKPSLLKRSKASTKKHRKEEQDRKRAMHEGERREREFFARENSLAGARQVPSWNYDHESWMHSGSFGSLNIRDYSDLPALSSNSAVVDSASNSAEDSDIEKNGASETHKSVWGLDIPKSELQDTGKHNEEDPWDAEEMIKRAREEIERVEAESGPGKKKKKKKKLILLSS